MRKLGHVARDVAGVLVVVLMLLPSCGRIAQGADTPCDPAAPPRAGITYLCQGWSADKAEWWYHISQGTAIMPYAWFMALEQASGTAPFTAPDHLARLGFLPDAPSKDNPDGLPVGFAARELDFPSTVPFRLYKGKWIGFACSTCHTGQVRYNGTEIRIDGGPSHIDLEAFGSDLGDAILKMKFDPDKKERFFQRIAAGAGSPEEIRKLADNVQAFFDAFAARSQMFANAQTASPDQPVSGLGRLDAVQRGGNLILSGPLAESKNYASNSAPVRYPALWDTPYFDWVLYDTSIRQPLARHIVEALGVGTPFDPATLLTPHIVHGLLMDNIVDGHRALTKLESPLWPEQVLPAIDPRKLARGEWLYKDNCASCHALIERGMHRPVGSSSEDAVRIKVPTVPLDLIGTDPRQAATLAPRIVSLERIGGPRAMLYTDAVRKVTSGIVEQWTAQSDPNKAAEQEVDGGRPNDIRGHFVYRARPLNGVWAIAPYLHNGSVPNLHALLLPQAQRPPTFWVGSYEFDPVNVGFESTKPIEQGFQFDTTKPG
ncbi:MAG TPA: di-heme-cytochrome C peroxidase, partial [Acetobacteraceae bacterium]|nr:di-heme-cytochrome C peroxidase [Acetobacteraceae bacterium]